MRYTEARLAKITQEAYLADLDKDIIDFVPNFDETEKELSSSSGKNSEPSAERCGRNRSWYGNQYSDT